MEVLLGLGRCDEAAATLETYAAMVAECQSPYFSEVVEELQARLRL